MDLTIQDIRWLNEAQAWFDLGDLVESEKALNRISEEAQREPNVLDVRWRLFFKIGDLATACACCFSITEATPDNPDAWRYLAATVRKWKGSQIALELIAKQYEQRFMGNLEITFMITLLLCDLGKEEPANRFAEELIALASKLGPEALERLKRKILENQEFGLVHNTIRGNSGDSVLSAEDLKV